jgi:hypothetical protein
VQTRLHKTSDGFEGGASWDVERRHLRQVVTYFENGSKAACKLHIVATTY